MAFLGHVQVYTGNGKGKTTAALGLALRAAGWKYRTYFAQFMKKGHYGELQAIARGLSSWITLVQFGLPGFHHEEKGVRPGEREAAQKGLREAAAAMGSGQYRLIVLDEINTALHFKIVEEEAVLDLIAAKPRQVELILTGRYAPPAILEKADLITVMAEERHYFQRGVTSRKGIER